jgi:D-alanyl-D-alanine carboxypeptidase (penicillin-binding protein 5/6)
MRFTVFLISILLFHPALVYSDMVDIPAAVKSDIPPPDIEARSWLLADFETGWVLASENADLKIEPASLTKLMTSFLVFTALQNNELRMEDMVYVTEKAWRTGGSKMFIQVDTKVSVRDLIQGLIIQSGNDAAVALAEHIGGSEEGFASRMNIMAAKLGMTNSNFTNSSGLPDENQYSTAEDLVLLSIALVRQFPDLYKFYSQHEFTYNGITQQNRNMLLQRDQSIDGIKTGHTKKAGYCLIGTGVRDGTRLVAAVTGSKSKTSRADQVQALLQYGYGAYDGLVVYEPGVQVKTLPLWMGETSKAGIGVNKNLGVIFPKGNSAKLSAALELPDNLEAPITAGTPVGNIQVKYDGEPIYKTSLHVIEDYVEGPWYMQLLDSVKQLIF